MSQIRVCKAWKALFMISILCAFSPLVSGSMLLKKTTLRRREANASNSNARSQRIKAKNRRRNLKKKHKKRKLIFFLELHTLVSECNNDH
jgi:hypothetical protein